MTRLNEASTSNSLISIINSVVIPSQPGVYYFDDPRYVDQSKSSFPTYKHVALGGSFDHLHNGHKKLLYLAAQICTEIMTIGITGNERVII